MEFVREVPDKKFIDKNVGIDKFLVENNFSKIEKIVNFFNGNDSMLLVNGFMGTGKSLVVNQAFKFLNSDVILLKYNCFETTVLDDILLEFFNIFKKLTVQNIIDIPKIRTENFTQKINSYFDSIEKPIVIFINSFEQVLKSNRQAILNFFEYLLRSYKIKIVIVSRKFDYDEFDGHFEKIAISAFEKGIFERYLRSEDIKQIGPLSDELYKNTRGYYFYTALSVKIMKLKKLSLTDFLSEYSKSFLTFNDFILREALSLVDPVNGHLFRFLTIMRHPVSINLLKTLNLYDEEKVDFFVENMLLNREGSEIYLQDYYKIIAENSISENISVKIHKNCAALYETQLPLKPFERDLMISRHTMRQEIEYHELFIPKKPVLPQAAKVIEPETIQIQAVEPAKFNTKEEKDEHIKQISFVFDSEADEMAIMNKIAVSINRFVDISDKKQKTLEEVENKTLVELINLAKNCEQNFEWQKAVMIYQKALTLNEDDDYYTFLSTIYTKIAKAFQNISDWFNAIKYFELAAEFFQSAGDSEKYFECKYEIANIYYISFKREKAKNILNELLKENISQNLEIKSKLLLFDITGNWTIDDLSNITSCEDKPILAQLYFKYALNCDKYDDVENAVKYFKKCIEISHDINVNPYLSSSLTNLASIYDEMGKSDLAVKYLNESIRLDELTNNKNGIYISAMKLSEIYSINLKDKAISILEKAKECAVELNEPFYIASCEVALGDIYGKIKDYKNALLHYKEAYNRACDNFSDENLQKIEMRIKDISKVYHEE